MVSSDKVYRCAPSLRPRAFRVAKAWASRFLQAELRHLRLRQRANYLRAVQGELSRTIGQIDMVSQHA